MPVRPVTPVLETAEAPSVPQLPGFGATPPPPAVTLQVTGTPMNGVPSLVVSCTYGRQSSRSGEPVAPSISEQIPSADAAGEVSDGIDSFERVNSVTVPPTPPPNESSGSTGARSPCRPTARFSCRTRSRRSPGS